MPDKSPKIIIVGKGSSKNTQKVQSFISTFEPKSIPSKFLYAVYLYKHDHTVYQADLSYLSQGIDYENFQTQINKMGVKLDDILLIEIVVDLDKAQDNLSTEVDDLLSQFFTEDE